jgi:hypothetical protein
VFISSHRPLFKSSTDYMYTIQLEKLRDQPVFTDFSKEFNLKFYFNGHFFEIIGSNASEIANNAYAQNILILKDEREILRERRYPWIRCHNPLSYSRRFVLIDVNKIFDLYTNSLIDCEFDTDWKKGNFRCQFSTAAERLLLLQENCIQILDVSRKKITISKFPDSLYIRNAIFNPFNPEEVLALLYSHESQAYFVELFQNNTSLQRWPIIIDQNEYLLGEPYKKVFELQRNIASNEFSLGLVEMNAKQDGYYLSLETLTTKKLEDGCTIVSPNDIYLNLYITQNIS